MTKRIALFLLFTLMTMTSMFAAPVIFDNLPVEKVEITVSSPQDPSGVAAQVRSKMKTKEGDVFSQTDFDQDLKSLSGEFDRVDPRFNVVDGKLQINLKIWPKPSIRTLSFVGNDKVETKKLMKELSISICSVFDRKAFNQAFHNLKTFYVKQGYFEAELDYTIAYDDCLNEVDITITVCEGRSGRIKSIKFCGFNRCEENDILAKMVTKEYNFFLSWFNEEGTYREDAMQHDQFQIVNYLQNLGYADAQVDVEVTEADCDNRIVILISADRGELYTVDALRFKGNCLFTDEQIFSRFKIYPGDPYSPEKIRETIASITELYGRRGYIDAYVSFEPNLDCDHVYSIDFEIEEGEQFRVGLIKVFGNCTTQSNIILHETLLIPGEVFNVEKLKMTEKRLENIGYFKKVNVYAVKTEGCVLPGNYRDVHIEVDETSTGKFGLFFGFSTQENLFGGVNISENNFNIRGLPNVWSKGLRAARGGGEYLSMSAQVGDKSRAYNVSWTKPYFMDTKWSVGFDLDKTYNNYISRDLDIYAQGGTLRASRAINSFVRFQWHYRARYSDVHYDDPGSLDDYQDEPGDSAEKLKHNEEKRNDIEAFNKDHQLQQAIKNKGLTSATGISLMYDSTDSLSCPTKGIRSTIEAELAGVGGKYSFWAFSYLNTAYYPFSESLIMRYRADIRILTPFSGTNYDSMPMDERLFLGGNTQVRGYRPYRVGPVFEGTRTPSGGLSQQYFSAELNYKWHKRVDGFIFMDLGNLSEHQWNFDWNQYKGSVGYGMRICLLESLPPIMVGMGYPINPKGRSEVKNFFIQFGCKF